MTTWLARSPPYFTSLVHVDETAIGTKRKCNRGNAERGGTRWLFGIVDKANHKCLCHFIDDKSHDSIIPTIERHVQEGVTIHSDGANVYHCLSRLGNNHRVVVHERNLVDPISGVHTNYIENLWMLIKTELRYIGGSQFQMTDSHIAEFMYRFNRKEE